MADQQTGLAVKQPTQAIREGHMSLEELLNELAKYGKPRIAHTGSGWYCAVEMYVSAAGVDFKVDSDFGMKSPMSAATQCASRMNQALRDIDKLKG